ncbi:hypothetical protein [Leeuwenhoekiella sp. LLG6367-2.1]|uniref:hypothetical protein n=1 Tax=Leeuwenhoekiella sp. LLG6367-2.1 TaxID=3160833 RepID=UPI00386A73CB
MNNKHDIDTYSKLALGASFYLEESFRCIYESLEYEFAAILFSQLLENIEPSVEDRKIFAKTSLPNDAIGLLQSEIPDILSEPTTKMMSDAWKNAQLRSKTENHKFGLDHKIDSIEILGHLNNFGFFIETIINRHLLFLNQSGKIDDFSYSRFSVAKVMERIIYIFKEDLKNNTIHLNEVQNLFRLRNKTVHYTPDNAKVLKPRISELIKIWTQCAKLIGKLEIQENFNEESFSERILYHSLRLQKKWN